MSSESSTKCNHCPVCLDCKTCKDSKCTTADPECKSCQRCAGCKNCQLIHYCRICQFCQHSKTGPPKDILVATAESNLVRAASGAILANDRPRIPLTPDGPMVPFMAAVFTKLGVLSNSTRQEDKDTVTRLNNHVIRYLYETIPHPVDTLLGERFRRADGSHNNVHIPSIGQAGTTYARTCQAKRRPTKVPDVADVFDKLLKAPNKERDPHPGGNSSLTFAFAALVTHSLFRTNPADWNKNDTSSYLDLSPLYGSNQEEQDAVRIKDGFGRLHPDTFSEGRIVFLPPASAALLVMWNRNHNHIAKTILEKNEQGRWKKTPPEDVSRRMAQDEEIFQTARLVNCASFMSVVMGDYVAGFLGITREGSSWQMNPFDDFRDTNHQIVTRGQGNHVSVEFDVLYRWHSVASKEEEAWTLGIIEKIFPGRKVGDLTMADFFDALGRLRSGAVHHSLIVHPDPSKRNFGGIKRGPDGRFKDEDIADILQNATEDAACRYGARGTPEVLKVIEIVGMQQARRWGVATMNEFRVRMGLEPFTKFEDWNPDTNIAAAAKELYGHIDNLELYPGLHAEETAKRGPGSGLCAGYTITRGILSDAIALVRGDRFFTTDFTPANLTSWGITDVDRDPKNHAFGAYLPKLLQRALPKQYPHNSIYTLFPFFTPTQTMKNLGELKAQNKLDKDFEYDTKRPTPSRRGGQ